MPETWSATGFQGVPIVLYDLGSGLDGNAFTQSSLSSLTAKVYDSVTRMQIGSTITLVIADCIFDTIQTATNDDRYTGTNGFNFRTTVPGAYLRAGDGDQIVLIEVYFADTATPPVVSASRWKVTVKEVLGLA